MREAVFWISGAALAFFVTAAAFLLLANFATGPSERPLAPDQPVADPGPALELDLDENRLASLEALPDQSLDLTVTNTGDEDISDVNLTLGISSENTALPEARYYRDTVQKLPAGGSVPVRFEFDLSSSETTTGVGSVVPEPPRQILEIRATTPEGVSAVKTAIVPL